MQLVKCDPYIARRVFSTRVFSRLLNSQPRENFQSIPVNKILTIASFSVNLAEFLAEITAGIARHEIIVTLCILSLYTIAKQCTFAFTLFSQLKANLSLIEK